MATNVCPFDWNKYWCAASVVSSCWVAHLGERVPACSDLRENGSVSDSLWVSADLRITGACSELRCWNCVCDKKNPEMPNLLLKWSDNPTEGITALTMVRLHASGDAGATVARAIAWVGELCGGRSQAGRDEQSVSALQTNEMSNSEFLLSLKGKEKLLHASLRRLLLLSRNIKATVAMQMHYAVSMVMK